MTDDTKHKYWNDGSVFNENNELHVGRWLVKLILPGGRYGMTGSVVYTERNARTYGGMLPMVEFWDTSETDDEAPAGRRFVSRFYAKDLFDGPIRRIVLDHTHEDWTLGTNDYMIVLSAFTSWLIQKWTIEHAINDD